MIVSSELLTYEHRQNYHFDLLSLVEPLRPPHNIRLVNVERLKGRVRIPFDVNRINRTVEFHKELIAQGMPYLKASLIYGKDTYRFVGFDKIKEAADIQFPLDRLDSSSPVFDRPEAFWYASGNRRSAA